MDLSTKVVASYDSNKEEAIKDLLAGQPSKVQRLIAARGMRINAVRNEAPTLSPARDLDSANTIASKRASRLHGAALLSSAIKGAEYYHNQDHKPATATAVTKYLKSDDAPGVRYALDKQVTGSLVKVMMRVKKSNGGGVSFDSGPRTSHDIIGGRMADARNQAVKDIERAINDFRNAPRAIVRKRAITRVRSILLAFKDDGLVVQAARSMGWRA